MVIFVVMPAVEETPLSRIVKTYKLVDEYSTTHAKPANTGLQRFLKTLRKVWTIYVSRWVRYAAHGLSHLRFTFWKLNDTEYVDKDGILCWDLSGPVLSAENRTASLSLRLRYDDIFSGSFLRTGTVERDAIASSLRIPRDIILLYQDKDSDTLRKLELTYGVRVFWGRDFEKFRDRDRPFAPRGTTKLCFHGRYKNVLEAKAEVIRWVELQEEYKEEEILVPEHAIGNVIGRQGSRVAQMQLESRAKIDVERQGSRKGDFVQVMVSGRKPARTSARRLIQECIDHSERMRERDRIKENIRDVQRRIMYRESEDEEEVEQEESFPAANHFGNSDQCKGERTTVNDWERPIWNSEPLCGTLDGATSGDVPPVSNAFDYNNETMEVSPWDGRYTAADPRTGRRMRIGLG